MKKFWFATAILAAFICCCCVGRTSSPASDDDSAEQIFYHLDALYEWGVESHAQIIDGFREIHEQLIEYRYQHGSFLEEDLMASDENLILSGSMRNMEIAGRIKKLRSISELAKICQRQLRPAFSSREQMALDRLYKSVEYDVQTLPEFEKTDPDSSPVFISNYNGHIDGLDAVRNHIGRVCREFASIVVNFSWSTAAKGPDSEVVLNDMMNIINDIYMSGSGRDIITELLPIDGLVFHNIVYILDNEQPR